MLSVVIQPHNYYHMYKPSDIKSVSVIKFSSRAFGNSDYFFDVLYNGELTEEAKKVIFDNINSDNVITYSGNLLNSMLGIISKDNPQYKFDTEKIVGLMEMYADKYPTPKRWHKLVEALENYGYRSIFDRDNPSEMTANTLVLYRFMQNDPKFKGLL